MLQRDSKPVMKSVKSSAQLPWKLFYCPTFLDSSDAQLLSSAESAGWAIETELNRATLNF